MEVIQLAVAAGTLTGLTARINLGSADLFQRRQTTSINVQVPPECESTCSPVISFITANNCPPLQCCSSSFETSYSACIMCLANALNMTDYSTAQSLVDTLYEQCLNNGIQLPVLTYPGQNPNRPLSSIFQPSSLNSQITLPFSPDPSDSITQVTISALTASTTIHSSPDPSQTSLFSGTKSVGTSYSNLIAIAMMLGTWFYFAV
ncbi:hypothetical protein BYT27DRAFT_7082269 [Phlegmacium glaucopus]|nr:hypothetical protein BYT27DRAFT_7082269 [Phlegmacium glaucopus]